MRMNMIPPVFLCTQHLNAEHGELHKHHHNFVKQHSITGRVTPPDIQIEPESMLTRHDELAHELIVRGGNHKSPYTEPDLSYLPDNERNARVNRLKRFNTLFTNCEKCKGKMLRVAYIRPEYFANLIIKMIDEDWE